MDKRAIPQLDFWPEAKHSGMVHHARMAGSERVVAASATVAVTDARLDPGPGWMQGYVVRCGRCGSTREVTGAWEGGDRWASGCACVYGRAGADAGQREVDAQEPGPWIDGRSMWDGLSQDERPAQGPSPLPYLTLRELQAAVETDRAQLAVWSVSASAVYWCRFVLRQGDPGFAERLSARLAEIARLGEPWLECKGSPVEWVFCGDGCPNHKQVGRCHEVLNQYGARSVAGADADRRVLAAERPAPAAAGGRNVLGIQEAVGSQTSGRGDA